VPAALSLAIFAWLLTLHPTAAGRTYAAYGGMHIAVALLWLRVVDGVTLTRWDLAGAAIALCGMAVIALRPPPPERPLPIPPPMIPLPQAPQLARLLQLASRPCRSVPHLFAGTGMGG
jgi:hypothetical protein